MKWSMNCSRQGSASIQVRQMPCIKRERRNVRLFSFNADTLSLLPRFSCSTRKGTFDVGQRDTFSAFASSSMPCGSNYFHESDDGLLDSSVRNMIFVSEYNQFFLFTNSTVQYHCHDLRVKLSSAHSNGQVLIGPSGRSLS